MSDEAIGAGGAAGRARPRLLIVATVAITLKVFLTPFARHLRDGGWRVDAASQGVSADPVLVAAFDRTHDLPLSRSMLNVRALIAGARAIDRLLAETEPDLVHVHTPIASFLTRAVVRRMPEEERPSIVYTAHGFHFYRGGLRIVNLVFLLAERLAGRWTDRLIVMNDEDEAAARRYRIVPGHRLVRMPGIGLDTHYYAPGAAAPSSKSQRLPSGAYFVYVGEFSANKRQADAIAALARMRHADTSLVLVGQGSRRERLERLAQELGVSGRVRFVGFVDDIRPFVSSSVGLLLTSKREGLARCVMEALSLEIPVVASAARGNAELVGDAGFVVEVGDVDGIAAAMDRLMDDPEAARSMGRRGRARMVEHYELRNVIRLHDELYGSLLDERAARVR